MKTRMGLTVSMANDAFVRDPRGELARVLMTALESIDRRGLGDMILRDLNGNSVGEVRFEDVRECETCFWMDSVAKCAECVDRDNWQECQIELGQ